VMADRPGPPLGELPSLLLDELPSLLLCEPPSLSPRLIPSRGVRPQADSKMRAERRAQIGCWGKRRIGAQSTPSRAR
jgi:hypothetical protein